MPETKITTQSGVNFWLMAGIILSGLCFGGRAALVQAEALFYSAGVIAAHQIETAVGAHFQERLSETGHDFRIIKITGCKDVPAPAGKAEIRVITVDEVRLKRRISAEVVCRVEPHFEKRFRVLVELEITALAVAAAKPLARLQPIQREDLMLVRLDLAKIQGKAFTQVEEVIGLRARRKIDPQTVLREDLVEKPPLVQRGDIVTMMAEATGFKIATLGEVRQAGAVGDIIQVLNLDSQKKIQARVLDAKTVAVELTGGAKKGKAK